MSGYMNVSINFLAVMFHSLPFVIERTTRALRPALSLSYRRHTDQSEAEKT